MQVTKDTLKGIHCSTKKVQKIFYKDGGEAYVFQKREACANKPPTLHKKFPPVNRNEPMTKAAYQRTLNRYFEKLVKLDLPCDNCCYLTLTLASKEYDAYDKVSARFNVFTDKVRFSKKSENSYVGVIRGIEIQKRGVFHIHCILVFSKSNIKLTLQDYRRMWGWGLVDYESVYYPTGLLDYLTNPKNIKNSKFTRYPKGARFIYISPNLPKAESMITDMTAEEFVGFVENENTIGHLKFHKYYDPKQRRVRLCVDKIVVTKNSKKGDKDK